LKDPARYRKVIGPITERLRIVRMKVKRNEMDTASNPSLLKPMNEFIT
jgi:hypothetical protein